MVRINFTQSLKSLFFLGIVLIIGQTAKGQVSIGAIGTAYSQNFDGLASSGSGTWSDGTTLPGWYASNNGSIPGTYSANTGSTISTGLYSFGVAGTNTVTDRALGWIPAGTSGTTYGYYGWRLKNNTTKTINTLRVQWTGEQWSKTANANILQYIRLSYSTGATVTSLTTGTWTSANSSFQALQAGGNTSGFLDGNNSSNKTTTSVDIEISGGLAAGNEIMLRWDDLKDANNSSLAIDDISVTGMTSQTIDNFQPLSDVTYGDASSQLIPVNASSGLPITYTSGDLHVATINGNTITIVGPGYANIKASQSGNNAFTAAAPVTQSLKVYPKAPTGLSPSNISTSSFTANWNADNGLNDAETQYQLYLSTDPSFPDGNTIIPSTTSSKFIDISDLAPGTKYYYRVQSVTVDLYGDYSDAVFFTTTTGIQTFNINASPTFTTATLNWSNGNLSKRAVFVKKGTGSITLPSNGITYSPILNSNWDVKGDQLGSSGYYCVYNGTGTSVYLTHLYPGSTYTVQAFEYQGAPGAEYYLTDIVGVNNNPITYIPWQTTTWTNTNGVTTSENWNTAGRWDHDTIPTKDLHPAVLVYIDGNCQVTNTAESNNLTIKAVHSSIIPKLLINTAQSLHVVGSLVNSGNPSALLVRSAANTANGSLVFGSGSPQGSVEMYSKASKNSGQNHWQYFGIPVQSQTVGTTFNVAGGDERVRRYNEANHDATGNDIGLWYPNPNALTMSAGELLAPVKGYEVVQTSTSRIYTFQGTLNSSDINYSLGYTTGADYKGSNIISNPFTAAIDISKLTFTNADNTVYIYNTGSLEEWTSHNGITTPGSDPGTYMSVPSTLSGQLGIPSQIPSMQGFLINAVSSGASIGIPYSAIVSNTTPQRVKGSVSTSISGTRIDVVGTNNSDRMWIFTDPAYTRSFDNGFDGRKILSSTTQLFAMETDDNYQIDAVNDLNETYLGFQSGVESNFTMNFTHQNLDSKYSGIYLVDLVGNKTVDITASGTEYSFVAAPSTTATKRFKIVTATTSVLPVENTQLKIFSANKTIIINNMLNAVGQLAIYDAMGRKIQTFKFDPNAITNIPTNLTSGVYILKVTVGTNEVTKRIIIN